METTRRISTSPQTARREIHDSESAKTQRLIAKIVREVAASQRFESFGELRVAVRQRLGGFGIRYRQNELDDALSVVSYSTRIVESRPQVPHPQHVEHSSRPLNRREAADVFDSLAERFPALKRLAGRREQAAS